jgi:hypothetical protein
VALANANTVLTKFHSLLRTPGHFDALSMSRFYPLWQWCTPGAHSTASGALARRVALWQCRVVATWRQDRGASSSSRFGPRYFPMSA